MSPTILAMLQAVERKVQRDASAEFFQMRESGFSTQRAGYYSDRRACWADACETLRCELRRYRFVSRSPVATFYGSTALAVVGL